MLISIDTGRPVSTIPHAKDYLAWRSRLTAGQYEAIVDELNTRIEAGEVHTSSWMPGANWQGTVFQPIYEDACNKNPNAAALFFGLILWNVMMERDDCWSYGRFEKDGID
ncbi:MAG TPA: hypothetical protein VLK84_03795, partial [Longimicrobium sp.]|nr:hypothetical protein [Longimicrobium sp.]